MPTLVHIEGWDDQPVAATATPGGGGATTQLLNRKRADTVNQDASHSYSTSVVHHAHTNSAALRITNPANVANWIRTLSGTSQHAVIHLAFRYAVLPVATNAAALVRFMDSAGVGHDIQMRQTGALRASFGGVNSADAGSPTVNTWYILEAHCETVGTTHDLVWKVYPAGSPGSPLVAQRTDSGLTLTDGFITEVRVGGASAVTTAIDLYLDDWLLSETAADYPLGEHYVKLFTPNGKGTHNPTATFKDLTGAQITNTNTQNAHLALDDIPADGTTGITQGALDTAAYLEFTLNSNAETIAPDCVSIMAAGFPSSTTASTIDLRLSDAGTESPSMLFDDSAVASQIEWHTSTFPTRPGGGAHTAASLQAYRLRVGYSDDATPDPVIADIYLQASFSTAATASLVGGKVNAPSVANQTFGGTLSASGTSVMDEAGIVVDTAVAYGGTLAQVGSSTGVVVPSLTADAPGTLEILIGAANTATAITLDPGWQEKADLQQNLAASTHDQTIFVGYRVVDAGPTNAAIGTLDSSQRWAAVHLLLEPSSPQLSVTIPSGDVAIGGKAGDAFLVVGTATSDAGTPTVTVNGNAVTVDGSGNWQYQITLALGVNTVTAAATLGGKTVTVVRLITVTDPDQGGSGGSGDPGTLSGDAERIAEILQESGLDPK